MLRLLCVAVLVFAPVVASGEFRVFACEPEWAALASEIGRDKLEAFSATTALQDPHYIQARPSLIARVRRADLVICSGAQLEIGWLPALLQKANNRSVMRGTKGYMEASLFVLRLGATKSADRAQGDIHPQGNPHVQMNPHNIAAVAEALAGRLAELDPGNAAAYEANHRDFADRWSNATREWERRGEPLRGKRVITHHRSWVYLADWLDLEVVATLEPVAGIPPTATHLSKLTTRFGEGGADVIIRAPYQDGRPSEWLSGKIGIPAVMLPLTVGGSDAASDLFALFDDVLDRLLEVTGDD